MNILGRKFLKSKAYFEHKPLTTQSGKSGNSYEAVGDDGGMGIQANPHHFMDHSCFIYFALMFPFISMVSRTLLHLQ